MKELEKEFTGRGQVKGFTFTQIKQNDHVNLYKVTANGHVHYEVFERKFNTRFNCESYPSNKAFGVWAWTSRDIAKILNTFDELTVKCELKALRYE